MSLSGHCSAINNNTLYVFSPTAFQALPLQVNATWSSLPTGEAVTGASCAVAVPNGDASQAAFYVVGGTSKDSSYGGLQRYNFNQHSWETLTPTTSDMQGRTDHSVAFLNASQSILVYAGSRPDSASETSSQTFLIGTSSPYNIESFTSSAPPLNQPILLPWDSSSAVMLGGGEDNEAVYTFGPDQGWMQLGVNLTSALPAGARGALVSGSDGSKVIEVYDASVAPNTIQQIVLLGANGAIASNGQTVGSKSKSSKHSSKLSRKRKRDLTISNWPAYNSTNAPSATRSDYSVAQGSNGMAVLSGGNDGNPLNIFNQQKNAWIDNSEFFGDSTSQIPIKTSTSSTTSAAASATASSAAAASSSAAASITGGSASKAHMLKVLGITLGVLCGIAAVFILALLLMRWRRQRRKREQEYVDEKSNRMSFQDRGASFMKEAGGSVADLNRMMPPPPNRQFHDGGNNAHSSLAIIAGKFGPNRHSRNNGEKGSFESTTKLVKSPDSHHSVEAPVELDEINGNRRQSISRKPVPHSEPMPPSATAAYEPEYDDLENKKRSSGWSRYFATNEEGLGPNVYKPTHPNPSAASLSEYTASRAPSMPLSIPSSALVPPLDIDFNKALGAQRMSNVAQGRPSFSHSAEDLAARGATPDVAEGQQAAFHTGNSLEPENKYLDPNAHDYFSRARERESGSSKGSRITSASFFSPRDGMSSPWTPMTTGVGQPVRSMGAHSIKEVQLPATGHSSPAMSTSAFPRPPSPSGYPRPPSSNYTNDRDSRMTDIPGRALSPPITGPPSLAVPGPAARGRAGNAGFFPGSGNRDEYRPNSARKIGGLHPGTLAAISSSGLAEAENRDSSATVWPSGGRNVSDSYAAARERLRLEKEQKEREGAGSSMSQREAAGMSDMSWVNINQR
ncbi:hypothetical protein MBLNU459_g7005t1 [Dothideomycetes sp. NU459]